MGNLYIMPTESDCTESLIPINIGQDDIRLDTRTFGKVWQSYYNNKSLTFETAGVERLKMELGDENPILVRVCGNKFDFNAMEKKKVDELMDSWVGHRNWNVINCTTPKH